MNNIGKNVDSMNFEELRSFVKVLANNVQELSDLYAKTKREYNDMLYNLSRDNLSIEYIQEEKEFVNSTVGDKMKDYSTIEQTEEKIKLTVGSSVSSLKQYSKAELSNATRVESIDEMEFQNLIYYIDNDDESKTYYVYNPLLQIWTPIINYVGQKYSTIEQTDEKIASSVISNKKYVDASLTQYSTTEQTAEKIATSVSETKKYVDDKLGDVELDEYTTIEQTADSIKTIAAKQVNLKNAIEVKEITNQLDEKEIYKTCEYSSDGKITSETYYYYDELGNEWIPFQADNIYTVFKQTSEGFEFKGNVRIDASLIVQGEMKGINIYVGDSMTDQPIAIIADDIYDAYIKVGTVGVIRPSVSPAQMIISSKTQGADMLIESKTLRFNCSQVEGLGVVPVFG